MIFAIPMPASALAAGLDCQSLVGCWDIRKRPPRRGMRIWIVTRCDERRRPSLDALLPPWLERRRHQLCHSLVDPGANLRE